MNFDLYLYHPRPEEMAARVRQAESGGFDGLLVAESTADPFQCLAVAAPHLSSLTLGTSVALAFPRSPMVTAVAAWDLQRATRGRFVLGLGSQVRRHIERRFSAPFAPPAVRLREYAQAVRQVRGAFQGSHELGFDGTYYQLDYLRAAGRSRGDGRGSLVSHVSSWLGGHRGSLPFGFCGRADGRRSDHRGDAAVR